MPFVSRLRQWVSDYTSPYRTHDKDQQSVVCDSLMMELDFRIKELEEYYTARDQEEKQQSASAVDYSWLASTPTPKTFEIPQLERLELEELCYKVKASECSRIIGIFRDALVAEPPVDKLPRILRSAVIQVIEERPKEETLTDWVTKRTASLTSLRISVRPNPKVTPLDDEQYDDMEKQGTQLQAMGPSSQTFLTVFHGNENEETSIEI